MANDVLLVFAGLGAIIFVGFLGSLLFEKTKIPDVLILIFIGVFLGQILIPYIGYTGIVNNVLTFIAPYFAALALVIILFDGGLNLNLDKVMSYLGIAIFHTLIAFLGTMFVTAFICYYFLGIANVTIGLFLGCILAGVSSAVVLPIMHGVSAKEETRTLLTIESVLTDVLCIVTALVLIEIMIGEATDTGQLIQQLLAAFILAGFIGLLFGIAWLGFLKRVHGKPFGFMVTIAALFILYAGVEYIQVSGAIAALVFGLVLTNRHEVARMFKIHNKFVFEEKIKEFHGEISFLVRTFFFTYLGLTFTFSFTSWNYQSRLPFNMTLPAFISGTPMYMFITVLLVIFVGIFIVRYIAASVTVGIKKEMRDDKSFLYSMLPRGLAAAVIAQLPFVIPEYDASQAAYNANYAAQVAPHQELFVNMAFLMIVLSVIATTIGVSSIERSRKRKAEKLAEAQRDEWAEKSRMYRKQSNSGKTYEPPVAEWKASRETQQPVIRRHIDPPTPPPPSRSNSHSSSSSRPVPRKSTSGGTASSKPHPLLKRAQEAEKKPPKKRN